ncbi:uncharacterized protein EI97DRAFT_42001 [Westerdykella ornata]|uniref:Uncharacterized protein n=1 Tax=Westerdykella ornata TaxID=318751 RepID=A0A6A6JIU7_WESOR|nr:uncharacterized protein EI97DRAFT_42001 [Westerdykella ornata]KAF2276501.1 hypothetical protein EI97DRAFT_42001 [Westerdykella ornata]
MESRVSTTTLVEEYDSDAPPDYLASISEKDKKELISSDAHSIASDTTLNDPGHGFKAAKSLTVSAKGISAIRLPTPSSQLTIDIFNSDGSLAYRSTRANRCSGNSLLSDSHGRPALATEYFFGPNRDPVIHILDENSVEIADTKTVSRWTSRSHTFLLPDGREFTWKYVKERLFAGDAKKVTSLVLTCGEKRLAVLRRDSETRTPGTKACTAGNGGELLLSEEVGSKEGVSEEVVVATCLLMLKKEIDRRRAIQAFMVMSVASS